MKKDLRLAVLIDAENIASKYIEVILRETNSLGNVIYKRIYGNWTAPAMSSWRSVVLDNAIQPIQQYSNTVGKNSSDSALIIDAMDLLYSGRLDGFCLVSSDSDFTRLASRLRESDMYVLGMGERKTPRSFISACSKFAYLDLLYAAAMGEANKDAGLPATAGANTGSKDSAADAAKTASPSVAPLLEKSGPGRFASSVRNPEVARSVIGGAASDALPGGEEGFAPKEESIESSCFASGSDIDKVMCALRRLADENSDEDGWIFLGILGNLIIKTMPDFDVRNFGFSKLKPFILSLDMFESREIPSKDDELVKSVYVRLK